MFATLHSLLLAVAAVLGGAPGAISASGLPGAGDGAVWHIRVQGDLDSASLGSAFADDLAEADADRAGLILIEVDGRRARLDVVWMMGRAIRDARSPVALWLRGEGGEVGLGAAVLGSLADTCWVDPATTVISGPGDDLAELAPEDLDRERMLRELRGAMWVSLGERGADRRLAEALVQPRQEAWAGPARSGVCALTLGSAEREPGSTRIVDARANGEVRVRIDAPTLCGLGLATGEARAIGGLLRRAGAPTVVSRRRALRSGLADAEREVRTAILRLDEAIAQIERTLRVRVDSSLRGPAAQRPYHEAGQRAAALVAEAARALDDVEAQLRTYPEILRLRGPGQAELGDESPSQHAAAWRRALERRRRDLNEARAQAEDYKRRE